MSKQDESLSNTDSSLQCDSIGDADEIPFNIEDEVPLRRADMELAIEKYIKLVRMPETDQAIKEDLVSKLCAMRIKLHEMNEEIEKTSINGHSLYTYRDTDSPKTIVCCSCGRKSGWLPITLPSLLRSPYESDLLVCNSCNLHIHRDCLNKSDLRQCPRVDFDKERSKAESCQKSYEFVVLKLRPEIGLAKQNYECAECNVDIILSTSNICDYDGKYYCTKCHTGDTSVIPARIIHNWDFTPRSVSKKSLLLINYIRSRPILFNILQLNSMLYGFVDELVGLKKIRKKLISMVQYTRLCRQPSKPKMTISKHLLEESLIDCYTLDELAETSKLQKELIELHSTLMHHITKSCESCKGKGFYCELCQDKGDLLFPFASNIASCPQCSAVYHKNCYHRKNRRCMRCKRLQEKNSRAKKDNDEDDNLF